MFVLAEMSDTIRVPPHTFNKKLDAAIRTELNKKLANKVMFKHLQVMLMHITLTSI